MASITFSATGAGAFAPTTATTLPVSPAVSATGLTTLAYSATDHAGNIETPKQHSVLVLPGLSCTAPTPARFTIPSHGQIVVTGTPQIGTHTIAFRSTRRY